MKPEIKKIKENLQVNDLQATEKNINHARKHLKNYPLLIALEGIYYTQTGDFEKALSALATAAHSMPRDPVLFYNLAEVLRAMGRPKAAEEAIRKSLHINPFNPFAIYELAQIETLQGKHSEAIMTLFKCIKDFSLFFPAYVALAQYLIADNQTALAIKLYETAVAGAPEEQFFKDRLRELKGL
ncbi:MAG: tetratricopeptide repeat protein [Myxococcaceae bacterium]